MPTTTTPRALEKKRSTGSGSLSLAKFGTKIHAIVDALGNPIGFTLSGANLADIIEAPALLDQAPGAEAVIADKGYDANTLIEQIESTGAEAIIPAPVAPQDTAFVRYASL